MLQWSTSMKAVKHVGRGKHAWKKVHLGVDRSGMILAEILTDGHADYARTALGLIDEVDGDMASFTADAAYDTTAINEAAGITAKGGPSRLQHSESNGCARPPRLLPDRQRMKIAQEGRVEAALPIHAPTPPNEPTWLLYPATNSDRMKRKAG